MPSNDIFRFSINIGETPIAEYEKDGNFFVECNLFTPLSYQQKLSEEINGEVETQSWPVTPYEIMIATNPRSEEPYYYRVFVDGMKIKGVSVRPNESRSVKGFRDGTVIRELLFAMPRFASDSTDRLCDDRVSKVGQIEVECYSARLLRSEWKMRSKEFVFTQANKKDSSKVTKGQFTMTTSKAGRVIKPRAEFRCVDHWMPIELKSRLTVFYRMGNELREMGFKLRPFKISPDVQMCDISKNKSNDEDSDSFVSTTTKASTETRLKRKRSSAAGNQQPQDDSQPSTSRGHRESVLRNNKISRNAKTGNTVGSNQKSAKAGRGFRTISNDSTKGLSECEKAMKFEVDEDGWPVADIRNQAKENNDEEIVMIDITSSDDEAGENEVVILDEPRAEPEFIDLDDVDEDVKNVSGKGQRRDKKAKINVGKTRSSGKKLSVKLRMPNKIGGEVSAEMIGSDEIDASEDRGNETNITDEAREVSVLGDVAVKNDATKKEKPTISGGMNGIDEKDVKETEVNGVGSKEASNEAVEQLKINDALEEVATNSHKQNSFRTETQDCSGDNKVSSNKHLEMEGDAEINDVSEDMRITSDKGNDADEIVEESEMTEEVNIEKNIVQDKPNLKENNCSDETSENNSVEVNLQKTNDVDSIPNPSVERNTTVSITNPSINVVGECGSTTKETTISENVTSNVAKKGGESQDESESNRFCEAGSNYPVVDAVANELSDPRDVAHNSVVGTVESNVSHLGGVAESSSSDV